MAMPEKTLNEIPRDLRDLYQRGSAALQRQNFDYAITFFQQVLAREPGFLECRQALRAAQFKKVGGSTGFFKKVIGGASAQPLIAKAQMAKGRNPLEAIQIAEQILESDPSNSSAHKILAECAMQADLPKTACFSYEILLKNSPKDYDLSMAYGEALAKAGQIAKAEQIYTELLRSFPHRGEINEALKNLSANKTLTEGGYDALAGGTGSYRDILKDKNEAVSLEQQNRVMRSEDRTEQLIAEYEAQVAREPGNLKRLRDLAELYRQKKDFDKSLAYYERIRSSEGGVDPSLEKAIGETTTRKFDHLISQLDPNNPEHTAQLDQLKKEKSAFQLEEVKKRSDRYPTDLQIKFELGQLYFQAGKYNEAMAEFQKAQTNPQRRLQSMAYLGQCLAAKGMNDMAARKMQEALKEKVGFDEEKKEMIYQLGVVLDKMGRKDEAIEQFKQIYEVDIGYKDVAKRVDDFYAGQT
jgi:tetratricopeptide (TPR) repeat protein